VDHETEIAARRVPPAATATASAPARPAASAPAGPAVARRRVLRGLAGAGVAAVAGTVALGAAGPVAAAPRRSAAPAQTDPATRRVTLVGANPAVQLFDAAGACTAYASAWRVDWSPHGRGTALVLWQGGRVQVYGADTGLARWVEREFVRFFPEVEGLPWPEPTPVRRTVRFENDLATGTEARAGDVRVALSRPLDRRAFATEDFPLGGVPHSLSLVVAPCGEGGVWVRGRRLPGELQFSGTPERPGSSAFTTEAEVWRR
jgi:hypothetical protein